MSGSGIRAPDTVGSGILHQADEGVLPETVHLMAVVTAGFPLFEYPAAERVPARGGNSRFDCLPRSRASNQNPICLRHVLTSFSCDHAWITADWEKVAAVLQ